jgi:hypothetical protein
MNFVLPGSEWGVSWEVVAYTGDGMSVTGRKVDRAFELIGRSMAVMLLAHGAK